MRAFADELLRILHPACLRIEVAGSIRRCKPLVGDIELVAVPRIENLPGPVQLSLFGRPEESMNQRHLLWETLDRLHVGYLLHGERYRRFRWKDVVVDVFTCDLRNWGWIFLHRTGPPAFRDRIGWLLAQEGHPAVDGWIWDVRASSRRRLDTPSEEDVFALAGLHYIAPEHRG